VLSVLLRYTDSDCPFGIFKLFLQIFKGKNERKDKSNVFIIHLCQWLVPTEVGWVYSIEFIWHQDCQWLTAGEWFSAGTPVSSANKTDGHDITEILLKVALETINPTPIWHQNWFNFVLLDLKGECEVFCYIPLESTVPTIVYFMRLAQILLGSCMSHIHVSQLI